MKPNEQCCYFPIYPQRCPNREDLVFFADSIHSYYFCRDCIRLNQIFNGMPPRCVMCSVEIQNKKLFAIHSHINDSYYMHYCKKCKEARNLKEEFVVPQNYEIFPEN